MTSHDYAITLGWEGNTGDGTATYRGYAREYRITAAGKPDLIGSADPAFLGDPARHSPEDLLVAALASCHMLSYLALCARRGVRVEAYRDAAHGRLTITPDGGRFTEVVLAPHVTIAADADARLALALHDDAHAACFIARSCNFAVRHRATISPATAAPAAAPPRGDLAIRLADRPGALAQLGELLAHHGISVEGGGGFVTGDACVVHFLVGDPARAADVLRAAHVDVIGTRDVLVRRLAQGTPGQLGAIARALTGAGVNIECMYSDHDHQLILVVDDLEAARRATAAWQAGRA